MARAGSEASLKLVEGGYGGLRGWIERANSATRSPARRSASRSGSRFTARRKRPRSVFASFKAKWDEGYRERWGIFSTFPDDIVIVSTVIVLALACTETISWGVLYYTFAVLMPSIEAELGWSRVAMTGAFSLALLLAGLAAPLFGRWLGLSGMLLALGVATGLLESGVIDQTG